MKDDPVSAFRLLTSAFCLAVLLSGCATTADIDNAKSSWQSARFDDVVARWGAPNRETILADGRIAATWVAEGGYGGGVPASVGVFGGSGGGGIGVQIGLPGMGGGYAEPQRCERTLIFKSDVVVEQSWFGQPALCRQFGRT